MEQVLSTDTFEHGGQRVQLTEEERRYLEHEIAADDPAPQPQTTETTDSTAKPGAEHEHADPVDAPKPSISQHEAQPPVLEQVHGALRESLDRDWRPLGSRAKEILDEAALP